MFADILVKRISFYHKLRRLLVSEFDDEIVVLARNPVDLRPGEVDLGGQSAIGEKLFCALFLCDYSNLILCAVFM